MAYSKTTWQNNVTDIDENNLNKIEQGIYDNSLVVEAVTNTLNPTDTETYKTAELTEGQITDVIGVNDILIKGQTSQDGEPTPDSPVDVNVVSGSNVIKLSSKNLLDGVSWTKNYALNENNTAFSANGWEYSDYVDVTNANYYYSSTTGVAPKTILYNNNKQVIKVLDVNSNAIYNISQYNAKYIRVSTATVGKSTTKVYEHQVKELPLDLPVENLFDGELELGTFDASGNPASSTSSVRTKNYIQVKPNTNYIISNNFNYQSVVQAYNSSKTFIKALGNISTFTTDSNTYYIKWRSSMNANENNLDVNFQLEQGSKANAYTPYGTDPIELCKIGDYQDYFYKGGSKWYLHKEIGKVIFDENTSLREQSQTGFYRYTYTNSSIKNDTSLANSLILFSNYFKPIIFNSRNNQTNETVYAICNGYSGQNAIMFNTTTFTSLNDLKTWLATNNVSIYHLLETPTNTEITDITLISQLEAIYNAPLYEQTNITQENNDLPMVLDITACKDNINGIKAFIRK